MQRATIIQSKALAKDDVNTFILKAMNKGLFIPKNGTACDRVT